MKKFSFTTFLILFTTLGFSQTKLSKETINEYAHKAYYNFRYTKPFQALIFSGMSSNGYSLADVATGMEKLSTNYSFREATFQSIYRFWGSSEDFLFSNLCGMGISGTNSKILAKYIITKNKEKE